MLLSLVMVLFHVTCFISCLPLTTSETMLVFLWAGLMLLKAFVHRTCLLDVTFFKKKKKRQMFFIFRVTNQYETDVIFAFAFSWD